MPLAFESISHGTIAFGFFNIDSDMLLLDRYFFFSPELCSQVTEMARHIGPDPYETSWEVYHIPDPRDIGDLMGAIHGIHYTGFLGEVYRRYPFPESPEDFKQNPEGGQTRGEMLKIIEKYAQTVEIPLSVDKEARVISIGVYRFTRPVFHELIRYVWQGGYPRWRDDIRPDHVVAMEQAIRLSSCHALNGLDLIH